MKTQKTDSYIFNPKKIESKDTDQTRTEKLYCLLGQHDFIDEDNNPRLSSGSFKVLAKSVKNGSANPRYFIKVGAYGRICNPIGMYTEGTENKFLSKIGRDEWTFKEVNINIFDQYVNFLRTKNIAWLNNAEREMV